MIIVNYYVSRDVAAADSVCSGRGDCLCSECQCHSVPGLTGEVYQVMNE